MPKIFRKQSQEPNKPERPRNKRKEWKCPKCGAIHWYNFTDGCHSPKCKYKGSLELID